MNEPAPPPEAPHDQPTPTAPTANPGTVATRASCFTFIVLAVICLLVGIYIFFNGATSIPWWHWLLIGLLVVAIPIVVFRMLTLYMMSVAPKYPDIHHAWQTGVNALHQNGMSLHSAPIYLVFGGLGPNARRNFLNASGYQFRVSAVPEGPAPFHWYANNDVIIISMNDVSWMHAACTLVRPQRAAPGGPAPAAAPPSISSTIRPGEMGALAAAEQAPAPEASAPPPAGMGNIRGTIVPGTIMPPSGAAGGAPAPAAAASTFRVDSETSTNLQRRLQHVCRLLRNARRPVCPVNGILALIPYEMLQTDRQDVKELERAVGADLSLAQQELQLRCPVTAVVTGMEKERGFRELIRRVGPQRASRQRFGQRFDMRSEATNDELTKFAGHVCGTFEDWVYAMFGEQDALSRPGNNLLFAMLCRVRRSVRNRLASVLTGFGVQPDSKTSLIFSGCYFAGTGPKGERQAFARGILDKLQDEQEEVEWTDEAVIADMKNAKLTSIGWAVAGLLSVVLIGLFVYSQMSGGA